MAAPEARQVATEFQVVAPHVAPRVQLRAAQTEVARSRAALGGRGPWARPARLGAEVERAPSAARQDERGGLLGLDATRAARVLGAVASLDATAARAGGSHWFRAPAPRGRTVPRAPRSCLAQPRPSGARDSPEPPSPPRAETRARIQPVRAAPCAGPRAPCPRPRVTPLERVPSP